MPAKPRPPSEESVVSTIMEALDELHFCEAFKVHGSPYARKGEPDIIGSYRGHSFAIEVKTGEETPTKIQQARLRHWLAAGARVGVAYSAEDALRIAVYGEHVNGHLFEY